MKQQESFTTATVTCWLAPLGMCLDVSSFLKKAKAVKCKEAKVRMPQKMSALEKIPLNVNILLHHINITLIKMNLP